MGCSDSRDSPLGQKEEISFQSPSIITSEQSDSQNHQLSTKNIQEVLARSTDFSTSRRNENITGMEKQTILDYSPDAVWIRTALRQIPLFYGLNLDTELQSFLSIAERFEFESGHTISGSEDSCTKFYVICCGMMNILEPHTKDEIILPEDSFGPLSKLCQSSRQFLVRAASVIIIYELNWIKYCSVFPNSEFTPLIKSYFFLSRLLWLRSLNSEDMMTICQAIEIFSFEKGETIISNGASTEPFYIIYDGVVRVSNINSTFKILEFDLYQGDIFGGKSLITSLTGSSTLIASDNVILFKWNEDNFYQLFRKHQDTLQMDCIFILMRIIPFFSRYPPDIKYELIKLFQLEVKSTGQFICREEEQTCQKLFIIKSGTVRFFRYGKELTVLESGQYFGEEGFHSGQPSKLYTAYADSETVLYSLEREKFLQFSSEKRLESEMNSYQRNSGLEDIANQETTEKPLTHLTLILRTALNHSYILSRVSDSDVNILVERMTVKYAEVGEDVMLEGLLGGKYFVIVSGKFQVLKNNQLICELSPGEGFGDMNLVSSTPCTYTVRSLGAGVLCHILKSSAEDILVKYPIGIPARSPNAVQSLFRMPVIASMKRADLETLLNDLVLIDIRSDEVIHRRGEEGFGFYIIGEGRVRMSGLGTILHHCDYELDAGCFFGEYSLLKNKPNHCSVTSTQDSKIFILGKITFNILFKHHYGDQLERALLTMIMKRIPYFHVFSSSNFKSFIDEIRSERVVETNVKIVSSGETENRFYIINHGTVRLSRNGRDIGILESYQYFGEPSLREENVTAEMDIITDSECVLYFLDKKRYHQLMKCFVNPTIPNTDTTMLNILLGSVTPEVSQKLLLPLETSISHSSSASTGTTAKILAKEVDDTILIPPVDMRSVSSEQLKQETTGGIGGNEVSSHGATLETTASISDNPYDLVVDDDNTIISGSSDHSSVGHSPSPSSITRCCITDDGKLAPTPVFTFPLSSETNQKSGVTDKSSTFPLSSVNAVTTTRRGLSGHSIGAASLTSVPCTYTTQSPSVLLPKNDDEDALGAMGFKCGGSGGSHLVSPSQVVSDDSDGGGLNPPPHLQQPIRLLPSTSVASTPPHAVIPLVPTPCSTIGRPPVVISTSTSESASQFPAMTPPLAPTNESTTVHATDLLGRESPRTAPVTLTASSLGNSASSQPSTPRRSMAGTGAIAVTPPRPEPISPYNPRNGSYSSVKHGRDVKLAKRKTAKQVEIIGVWGSLSHFRIGNIDILNLSSLYYTVGMALAGCFVFSGLSGLQLNSLIDAMDRVEVEAGERVITEGEEGNLCYIVESGIFSFIKGGQLLSTLSTGSLFGEFSLLSNSPRLATVRAEVAGVFFTLDRDTYRAVKSQHDHYTQNINQMPSYSSHSQQNQVTNSPISGLKDSKPKAIEGIQTYSFNAHPTRPPPLSVEGPGESVPPAYQYQREPMSHSHATPSKMSFENSGSLWPSNEVQSPTHSKFVSETFQTTYKSSSASVRKTPAQKLLIGRALSNCFVFAEVSGMLLNSVIDAMELVEVAEETVVIREGQEGNMCHVINSGSFSFIKGRTVVCTLSSGDVFGEFLLLSNSPSLATVVAETSGSLFTLRRDIFWGLKSALSSSKMLECEGTLMKVPGFQEIGRKDLHSILENMSFLTYTRGEYLSRKDSKDPSFFTIIHSGHVKVTNIGSVTQYPDYELGPGTFVGETEFLNGKKVNANIIALSNTEVFTLDKANAERLLGIYREFMEFGVLLRSLRSVILFRDTSVTQLIRLVKFIQIETFPIGYHILQQNDIGSKFYIIKDGYLKMFKDGGRDVGTLHHGQFFGEGALLRDEVRPVTMVAWSECTLLSIDRKILDDNAQGVNSFSPSAKIITSWFFQV